MKEMKVTGNQVNNALRIYSYATVPYNWEGTLIDLISDKTLGLSDRVDVCLHLMQIRNMTEIEDFIDFCIETVKPYTNSVKKYRMALLLKDNRRNQLAPWVATNARRAAYLNEIDKGRPVADALAALERDTRKQAVFILKQLVAAKQEN